MKGLMIKCVLVVCIALGASNYLLYMSTGEMPFSLDKVKNIFGSPSLPDMSSLPSLGGESKKSKQDVYKWTDENGRVHFSSTPPPSQKTKAETIQVDSDINVIQSVKVEADKAKAKAEKPLDLSPKNVYNPNNVKQLIDDAKAIQETMNQRNADLDKI